MSVEPTTVLTRRLADQIVALIRDEGFADGQKLTERGLAERMRVSRSPVKSALNILQAEGIVRPADRGGFVVVGGVESMTAPAPRAADPDDAAYARLVEDRLAEQLPERITENELLRRYDMTRSQLTRVLRRAVAEGWMERLPGHGWAFLPVLTSLAAYGDSYRFRLAIEPAAILEPTFVLDVEALMHRRRQQVELMEGAIFTASDAAIFEMNSGLHETIVACSRNSFFIDALKRLNRLRRLMEYHQKLDRPAALVRCREHVEIIDGLLAGDRAATAKRLHRHLATVGPAKSQRR
jgi:DNA-binding GntR family transcriptional regulator